MAIKGLPSEFGGYPVRLKSVSVRIKGVARTRVRKKVRTRAFLTNPAACMPATSILEIASQEPAAVPVTSSSSFTPRRLLSVSFRSAPAAPPAASPRSRPARPRDRSRPRPRRPRSSGRRFPSSSAQRSATQSSPSSVESIQPTGARVPPAVELLEPGDQLRGPFPGLAADGGGRMQRARQLDRAARLGELGADRRREVLDVRDLDRARAPRRPSPRPRAARASARSCARRSRAPSGPWRCAGAARRGGRRPPGRRCGASSRPARPCSRRAPRRRTRSSGLAPTNAASGVPTQKQ